MPNACSGNSRCSTIRTCKACKRSLVTIWNSHRSSCFYPLQCCRKRCRMDERKRMERFIHRKARQRLINWQLSLYGRSWKTLSVKEYAKIILTTILTGKKTSIFWVRPNVCCKITENFFRITRMMSCTFVPKKAKKLYLKPCRGNNQIYSKYGKMV